MIVSKRKKRFIHVGISETAGGRGPNVSELERVFKMAQDWIRYDYHCWILYSAADLIVWRERIKKVPGLESAAIFLCAFDRTESTGYLPKELWVFFDRHRRDGDVGSEEDIESHSPEPWR